SVASVFFALWARTRNFALIVLVLSCELGACKPASCISNPEAWQRIALPVQGYGLNYRDLRSKLRTEQTLRDQGMDTANDVHHLGHPKAHRDAAQSIGVKRAETGTGCQKVDSVAGRQAHGRIQIFVHTQSDPVRRGLRHRPIKILLL